MGANYKHSLLPNWKSKIFGAIDNFLCEYFLWFWWFQHYNACRFIFSAFMRLWLGMTWFFSSTPACICVLELRICVGDAGSTMSESQLYVHLSAFFSLFSPQSRIRSHCKNTDMDFLYIPLYFICVALQLPN